MYDKITALYCRYSHDDGQETENESITHQKALLKEYAENNGYSNLRYYTDDGYTGTDFNRPDFQRMMEDVENGIVQTSEGDYVKCTQRRRDFPCLCKP